VIPRPVVLGVILYTALSLSDNELVFLQVSRARNLAASDA
jgi:hypothetical protein